MEGEPVLGGEELGEQYCFRSLQFQSDWVVSIDGAASDGADSQLAVWKLVSGPFGSFCLDCRYCRAFGEMFIKWQVVFISYWMSIGL
jgi:hypothetical protein